MSEEKIVLIKSEKYEYVHSMYFRPSKNYPEYIFDELDEVDNIIYDMVRNGLLLMGYDKKNFGKRQWNPLGGIIEPGNTVVIKPNLVMDYNKNPDGGTECLYTQPSTVAPIIDYVIIALKGHGTIIIGDAPMQECNFDKLIKESGYQRLIEYYIEKLPTSISIELVDFRGIRSTMVDGSYRYSVVDNIKEKVVDLGIDSEFNELSEKDNQKLRITNYDPKILQKHHNTNVHEYCINQCILDADVFINFPKPKTHRKAGVTIALKNIVGISARKEYLPHHMTGSIMEGGDEHAEKSALANIINYLLDCKNHLGQNENYFRAKIYKKVISYFQKFSNSGDDYIEGNWFGNDTISKTIVDLNRILLYSDKNGVMKTQKQRRYLVVADMIISGNREGPLAPSPLDVGIIGIGENPVEFDKVIATLMGADISKLPTLRRANNYEHKYPLISKESRGIIVSNHEIWNGKSADDLKCEELIIFTPSHGWEPIFKTNN